MLCRRYQHHFQKCWGKIHRAVLLNMRIPGRITHMWNDLRVQPNGLVQKCSASLTLFETESVGDPSKQEKPKTDTARDKIMRQMAPVAACHLLVCVLGPSSTTLTLRCGNEKVIDPRCRATIGTVSNPSHGAKKLSKAGQRSWLGRRAVVRGVAMIPVDHPHVERSKSSGNNGRCSLTPWGKPCKSGN
ncbi:hypothetical protein WN943_015850 [Citrus x changshan-huyou]